MISTIKRGRPGRDRMIIGFTTTCAISAYRHFLSCECDHRSWYWIQHYVLKFIGDLRQVGDILRVLQFPPPIKPSRYS